MNTQATHSDTTSGLPLLARIKDRKDYLAVSATRRRWVTPAFILQAKADNGGDSRSARIGFTVSKKVGNAVKRSRAKRRLKEAVRAVVPSIAPSGWDFVVIGREAAIHYPFEKLQQDLKWAVAKLVSGADLKQTRKPKNGGKKPPKPENKQ